MAETICKANLASYQSVTDVMMPEGAKILSAAKQYDQIVIWFVCDPSKPGKARAIEVCWTGYQPVDSNRTRFIGTVLLENEQLVCHVFELGQE